jgi:hypothetical protein
MIGQKLSLTDDESCSEEIITEPGEHDLPAYTRYFLRHLSGVPSGLIVPYLSRRRDVL